MTDLNHYTLLSDLFRYPTIELPEILGRCVGMLEKKNPDSALDILPFVDFVFETEHKRIEEVFTKTFHIQAVCYLDLGYVIFGEDYKRGEFLVNMKKEQEQAGNDCKGELADNLTNILTLLPLLKDEGVRNDLVEKILVPGLEKMLQEFTESKMEQRNKALKRKHKAILQEKEIYGNVYQYPLKVIKNLLLLDFAHLSFEQVNKEVPGLANGFVSNCGTCLPISLNNYKNIGSC